jgi:hypothetical protein
MPDFAALCRPFAAVKGQEKGNVPHVAQRDPRMIKRCQAIAAKTPHLLRLDHMELSSPVPSASPGLEAYHTALTSDDVLAKDRRNEQRMNNRESRDR